MLSTESTFCQSGLFLRKQGMKFFNIVIVRSEATPDDALHLLDDQAFNNQTKLVSDDVY